MKKRKEPQAHVRDGDDEALIRRCRRGDEAAWRTLVGRYKGVVFSTALRTGLSQDDALEVFQRVWIELHRSLDRIRDPKALPRWLVVSARRQSYKQAASSARMVEGTFDDMVDPAALPEDELASLQRRQLVERQLERLGEPCASLLRSLFLDPEEPDYREIARRLGIRVGSIGPTRGRCLARLRKRMEKP